MPAQLLLTPALAESLADAVRHGVPVETAVRAAGISQQQYYAWLRVATSSVWPDGTPVRPESLEKLAAFAEQITQAQAEFEAEQVRAIAAAGEVVGKSGVPEWRARAFLLSNHPRTRERWGQHVQVEHTGQVSHEHSMAKALEPEQLAQAYAALEPGPEEPAGLGT